MCVHIYNIVCKCFFLRDSQCGLFDKGQMAVECFCVLQAMFFTVLLSSSVHARPPEFPGTHSPSSPEYCPSEQQKGKALLGELLRTHRVSSPLSLCVSSCVCPLDKSAWEMEIWGQWKTETMDLIFFFFGVLLIDYIFRSLRMLGVVGKKRTH